MTKKIIYTLIVIGIIAAIAFILFNNKQKMAQNVQTKKMSTVPVSAVEAKFETIDKKLSQVGTVFADKEVAVVSEAPGLIKAVYCDVGDQVKAGQMLFKVDDELKLANLKLREADLENSRKNLERYEALFKEGSATEAQLDGYRLAFKAAEAQLTIARRQVEDTRIKAPFSGVVTARMVNLGSNVNPGTVVVNLVDVGSLRVKLSITEKDVFMLKTGDKATITSDVFPDKTFNAKIKSIGVKGDETHSFPIELVMLNNRSLKAGMNVDVEFDKQINRESIVIPRIAILGSSSDAVVFVVEKNVSKKRSVTTGMESGTNIEILSGLKAGDLVVTSGQVNLKDGSQVSIVK
ncbi:MAG: MexH family multidrug efflux RND transporter periplasmic adaptor subunit [Ignavibacteriaceae bacterium]|nr:MAG: efflux RND transporter periplasmic adaptor subunit [Chlorobiota bacterium]GJQ32292.1 MAG: MexH family multidrug efflux RND transporter periplasmic adaptor subunit [Ignavibacteriaceae bacterium]